MLKSMREGMKPVMWIVAIAFVGAIFLWGASTGVKLMGEHKQKILAQVRKDTVEKDEFMDYLSMEYYITKAQYQQTYGQNTTPEIEQQILLSSGRKALEMLIHMKLLMQEANNLGIVVSDDEVRKYVRRSPYFLDKNGEFSFPQYQEILANYFHTTPTFFEEQIRKEIYSSNLVDLILASARFTPKDLKDIYLQTKKTADISLLFFPAKDYLDQVDPASLDVEQYFEQNIDKYQLPRQAKIRYIFIDLKQMEKELVITDDMLLSYYEEHKGDYAQAGLVHLRAILFSFPDKATAKTPSARKTAVIWALFPRESPVSPLWTRQLRAWRKDNTPQLRWKLPRAITCSIATPIFLSLRMRRRKLSKNWSRPRRRNRR
jgi:peptidyl-prolyl cis-trans isomerase D